MKSIEERNREKIKQDLIMVAIIYVISLIFSFQFYRAYLEQQNSSINDLINLMSKNMTQEFIFIPTKEYLSIFFLVTVACGVWALMKITDKKKYMKGEEHGSARWATLKEKQAFQDKNDANNIILSEDVKISLNAKKIRRNHNVLVIGGSGTGKTRFYVKPNLMQLNTSYVMTDPKGELLIETGKMFKDNGYKVKVLNVKDMTQSMGYNPFVYIKKEQDVFKLIKTLIKNTNEGAKGGDPFWEKAETAFLEAGMFYLYQERPLEEQTLPNLMKLLRCAKVSEEDENMESPLDIIFKELEEAKGETIAVKQYKVFKAGAGKTAKSILISALSRLAFLDLKEVQDLFSKDELGIENIGNEKTAFYIIIPDTDSSFNFIAAMVYTQLFDILCQTADGKPIEYPVRFIMDEFANIGQIPDFEKVLATVRSRKISVNIILQSLSQIENLYKNSWKSIVDNCDSTLYLGGQETSEWVSKRLGKMTIDSKVVNRSRGRSGSSSENFSILGRELMTADEVSRMPNEDCIIFIRGARPMYSKKYPIEKHKRYKELGDVGEYKFKNNFSFEEIERNRVIDVEENNIDNVDHQQNNLEDDLEKLLNNQIEIVGEIGNEENKIND